MVMRPMMMEVGMTARMTAGMVIATQCLLDASKEAVVEKTRPGGRKEPAGVTSEGHRPEAD